MSRSRLRVLGVGSDISLAATLQGGGAVVGFIYQMVLLRSLTKEDAGVYFLAIATIVVAGGMADFGLAATLTPRLAVSGNRGVPLFRAGLHLRALSLVLVLVALDVYLYTIGNRDLLLPVTLAYIATIVSSKATGIRQLFDMLSE